MENKLYIFIIYIALIVVGFLLVVAVNKLNESYKLKDFPEIPEKEEYMRIFKELYFENVNDCSNKAREYHEVLKERGYESDVLLIYVKSTRGYHALVRVEIDGEYYYADPTMGFFVKELSDVSKNLIIVNEVREDEMKLVYYEWEINNITYENGYTYINGDKYYYMLNI